MQNRIKGIIIIFGAALIWGSTFVAQSSGMNHIGPFTFNTIRSFLGFFALTPVMAVIGLKKKKSARDIFLPDRTTLMGGIVCGSFLGVASVLQQVGITRTSAGKTAFITAMYILLVPLGGLLFRKKPRLSQIVFIFTALGGFYLLCIHGDATIGAYDFIILGCAVLFSFHILFIDRYLERGADAVKMSCVQFVVAGFISLVLMLIFEKPEIEGIWNAKYTLLYAGVLSSGVAFTLQIIGQKYADPSSATLVMSLESVIASICGWIFLGEKFTITEQAGCFIIFLSVVAAQFDWEKLIKRKKKA